MSKSTFLRGLQCHKSLFLYKHHYHLRDKPPPEREAMFKRGIAVGTLARDLFPHGVDASPEHHFKFQESVMDTARLIAQGEEVIYEAAFQYEQVLSAMDLLVKKPDGWHAFEVKSSVRISDTTITDAALQYHVITRSGLPLADISIITIDSGYERQGDLEVPRLFTATSVLAAVQKRQDWISENLAALKGVIRNRKMPEIPIGSRCDEPFPCDFKGVCWKDVPADSVFTCNTLSRKQQFSLYHQGIRHRQQVPPPSGEHSPTIRIQPDRLRKFLDQAVYPIRFLDFEVFMPAIPRYDGTRPYQRLPFLFSLHTLEHLGAAPVQTEFLADPGPDPRAAFLEAFLAKTDGEGSLVVYDRMLEKTVLGELAAHFPTHAAAIENRLQRLVDLQTAFEKRFFHHSALAKGPPSLKRVIETLDPAIRYDQLSIRNGWMAATYYEQLAEETDFLRLAEVRDALTAYCATDTLALVKIWQQLEQATRDTGSAG